MDLGIKNTKVYAEILEQKAITQFTEAMALNCNIQGALMPDAHTGYTLPIGAVIKSLERVFPSYVGYDIGCGMCAVKLDIHASDLDLEKLKDGIISKIPLGANKHKKEQTYKLGVCTDMAEEAFEKKGKYQLGTLGGGNHFIEIGTGRNNKVWVIIHSGSRGFGWTIAKHYMVKAALDNNDEQRYEIEFEEKNKDFKKHNPKKFEIVKKEFVYHKIHTRVNTQVEGHFSFDIFSKHGVDYLQDLDVALKFALENRKRMIHEIIKLMGSPKELDFINRNHNHAEVIGNEVIHRKGATHAEVGMKGVIPGNMKDGSFIVLGKGNADSMNSSSHGAGRVLSRSKAKATLDIDEFFKEMEGVVSNHTNSTLDESPKAYKNIFEVMELQKDLVKVLDHVVPILNVKG